MLIQPSPNCAAIRENICAGRKPGERLQGPETERELIDEFSAAIAQRRYFECTLTNYHANKSLYRSASKCIPSSIP